MNSNLLSSLKNNYSNLLLIPTLALSRDFIPLWFSVYVSLVLIFITFIKIPKYLNAINPLLVLYVFYDLNYTVTPETTCCALVLLLLARIIQKQSDRHKGLIETPIIFLWLGVFAIFTSDLYYLLYIILFCFIIFFKKIKQHYHSQSFKFMLGGQVKTISSVMLLTSILFIFFPRFKSFLPTVASSKTGKIGYSSSVNNSETSNLQSSSKVAFRANTESELEPSLRYWRGKIHNQTDGYNWRRVTTMPIKVLIENEKITPKLFKTKIKYEDDFEGDIILLDRPHSILESNLRTYKITETNEFRAYRKNKKSYVISYSQLGQKKPQAFNKQNLKQYTQLPEFLPKKFKTLNKAIQGKTPKQIIQNFSLYIKKQKFSYTLSPGKLQTLAMFLEKKAGYCTHFASLLGIVLRYNNIPTRLVSGFQGGLYNKHGKYYEVSSNDAHVWVEYYSQKAWNRVDPTGFIAPERINLGGQNYLTNNETQTTGERNTLFKKIDNLRAYISFLNYKFAIFIDNYDRENQRGLLRKIKLKGTIGYIAGLCLFFLIAFIIYFYSPFKKKETLNEIDRILYRFAKNQKITKKELSQAKSIKELRSLFMKEIDLNKKEKISLILETYSEARYGKNKRKKDELIELIQNY